MKLWNEIFSGRRGFPQAKGRLSDLQGCPVILGQPIHDWLRKNRNPYPPDFLESMCARPPFPLVLIEYCDFGGTETGLIVTDLGGNRIDVTIGAAVGGIFCLVASVRVTMSLEYKPLRDGLSVLSDPRIPPDILAWRDDTYVALMVFTFMNCKNVSLKDPVSPKLKRAFERRRGCKPARYYTLDIALPKVRDGGVSTKGGVPIGVALHLCRGHFKQFSEEKPLFGKYAGRFWWASQVRGTETAGSVEKDYRVLPPPSGGEQ